MSVEVGAVYRSTLTVMDSTGLLVDPATKVLTVTLPDQTTATPAVTRDSLGTFHADYTMTLEGLHKFLWVSTGPVTSRTDYVNCNQFRSIIGIDEARDFIHENDTSRDPVLRQVMAAATELAESICGTCVIRTITDRIPGGQRRAIRLPRGPLPTDTSVTSITSVWPGGPAWVTAGLILSRESGIVEPADYIGFWWGPWTAVYTAGRAIISQGIQLAVKEIIFDMWSAQRPYGPDSLEPGPEDTARFEQMIAGYQIPPHARSLLEPDQMPGFA